MRKEAYNRSALEIAEELREAGHPAPQLDAHTLLSLSENMQAMVPGAHFQLRIFREHFDAFEAKFKFFRNFWGPFVDAFRLEFVRDGETIFCRVTCVKTPDRIVEEGEMRKEERQRVERVSTMEELRAKLDSVPFGGAVTVKMEPDFLVGVSDENATIGSLKQFTGSFRKTKKFLFVTFRRAVSNKEWRKKVNKAGFKEISSFPSGHQGRAIPNCSYLTQ